MSFILRTLLWRINDDDDDDDDKIAYILSHKVTHIAMFNIF